MEHVRPRILVTEIDYRRLLELIVSPLGLRAGTASQRLEREMATAEVVPSRDIAPDVATMNSRVRYENVTTGRSDEVTLVYPWDADVPTRRISVWTPLGMSLLGRRVGRTVECSLNGGMAARLRLLGVIYQPEASGHYWL